MRILVFILALHIAFLPSALSQPTQNIWGKVVDQESQRPLPYATVMILEAGPIKGVTTGEDGTFVIEDVPVGRYNVLVSYTGYESGKQGFLDIGLKESVIELGEVSIANVNKAETVNAMAGVSARSFTVEETEKYWIAAFVTSREPLLRLKRPFRYNSYASIFSVDEATMFLNGRTAILFSLACFILS